MTLHLGERVRRFLISAGARASARTASRVESFADAFLTAAWLKNEGFADWPRSAAPDRWSVFDELIARVDHHQLLYLEFGVWQGKSLRYWVSHISEPSARFVGFDSFEGLPDDWNWAMRRAAFSVAGTPPNIGDPRVRFEIGWFEQTLERFILPEHRTLIVNVDCDLYSSASEVLRWVEPHLVAGDVLFFDEFKHFHDERRAFNDHLRRTASCYELAACDGRLQAVAFRRTAEPAYVR